MIRTINHQLALQKMLDKGKFFVWLSKVFSWIIWLLSGDMYIKN